MENFDIYRDIADRTGGDIYIGVVGPVRTGKSTFIKRFMDLLVIPNIDNPYNKERTRDELPHAITCRVTEWEWPLIRVEIIVERDSQKAIVIGKGGEVLKEVGIAVRRELPEGTYLELHVTVERHWQNREDLLDRLGF